MRAVSNAGGVERERRRMRNAPAIEAKTVGARVYL